MKITGGMIVKNESDLMIDAIKSLWVVCDEILVVDNGSQDGTAEVAKSLGCRVMSAPREQHDTARQLYLDSAQGDWVLTLDADERLEPKGAESIRLALRTAADRTVAFSLPLFHYNGEGSWSYIRVPRLVRTGVGIRYSGSAIHSSPKPSISELGDLRYVYAPLHHLDSLITGEGRSKSKRLRNTAAIREELANPDRTDREKETLLGYLAVEHMAQGEWSRAEMILDTRSRSIPRGDMYLACLYAATQRYEEALVKLEGLRPISGGFREQYYPLRADILWKIGDQAGAMDTLRRGLSEFELSPHLHLALAAALLESAPDSSRAHLQRAADLNPWLTTPTIYGSADRWNIFSFQSSVPSFVKAYQKALGLPANIGLTPPGPGSSKSGQP